MMELRLPDAIAQEIVGALQKAGSREVGGVMMGEHVAEGVFRVVEITVQPQAGTFATFLRMVTGLAAALKRFFQRTNHAYTQFNYLGEWHSHPSFVLEPSGQDCRTMWDIVEDPSVGANFAALLIVKLGASGLEGQAFVFLPGRQVYTGTVMLGEQTCGR